jgi:hypothetical protein
MADWEDEMESVDLTIKTSVEVAKVVQESEDIIKPKLEMKVVKIEPKQDDYEKKWQDKNKELIDRNRKEEIALEGLDEKQKQKKIIDRRIINDACDFLEGVEKTSTKKDVVKEDLNLPLVTEKDFIDCAVKNVSKIKEANKPSKFTYTYLKNSIDLLGPTLDGDKLNSLIKDLTVMFNKKRKEESDKTKKPGKDKPSVSAGKGLDRAEKMGALEDYGKIDDVEEENYDEDDFI